jgi:hypothetical protein
MARYTGATKWVMVSLDCRPTVLPVVRRLAKGRRGGRRSSSPGAPSDRDRAAQGSQRAAAWSSAPRASTHLSPSGVASFFQNGARVLR